jgi:hypothetical protein
VFVGLNIVLRRQRRRIAVIVAMLTLAGAVVTAHSVMGADHMGDATAMCLAVVETAVIAVGGALIVGVAMARRPHWRAMISVAPQQPAASAPARIRARAGPPVLQVFRL